MIEERIASRLAETGIVRGATLALAETIREEKDDERLAKARAEMDDEEKVRRDRLLKDLDDLRKALERSRVRVGVDPRELQQVVATALDRAGATLEEMRGDNVGRVETYRFEPGHAAFARDPTWLDAFDDLRERRRNRGERINDWRRTVPLRSVSFEPPIKADGTDAGNVVQVHLEHRLVRRLLSRFLSHGFQSNLERVCAVIGPGAQPRVVLVGRLALYGPGAARLHEEFLFITAIWTEAERDRKPLRPLGERGQETSLDQLEDALRDAREAPPAAVTRLRALARKDAADLEPELRRQAEQRLVEVSRDLQARGEAEAKSLMQLLEAQRNRIAKADAGYDPNQLDLPGVADEERRQRERDRKHWAGRVREIEREIEEEPARVRTSYEIRAHRLEPVGLVYLWPISG